MRVIKKKYILPLIVFLVGITILTGAVYTIKNNQQKQSQTTAKLNAITYAGRMRSDMMKGISVTETLEQILVSEDGKIDKFSQVAKDMMTDSIQSIQIAPDGVVTEIYPEEGNEAGKIDLLHDKDRGEISRYAKDKHKLIMQGPFELKQGGYGIAVRKPVYLETEDKQSEFWGFTIAIIRVPDIFADSVKALSDFGYDYRLLKTVSPWEKTYEEVYSSGEELVNPVSYTFEVGGSQWKLEVMPKNGWPDSRYYYEVLIGGMMMILLLTGLTFTLMIFDEHRKKFRKLAVTDALTGIYNRHGFDELVEQYLKQYPKHSCVGAEFDIDDFKLINDMYGHASGDMALQILAKSMRDIFPKNAILGRSGGDEFCIFLPNCNCEKAKQQIEQFTKQQRIFSYEGEEHSFSISLGYAEYPLHAKNYTQLIQCADAALYEVKQRGKHGCLKYQNGMGMEIRRQLGFVLKDVSENLPGAFIIYKADKTDDEILFANREMIRLTGCKSMDELLAYTQKSFRNLIREDERKSVEESIWQQIEEGHFNDYIHFHLQKEDGTFLQVLDHGRIVENTRYGRVFYVLLMDWKFIKKHYDSPF